MDGTKRGLQTLQHQAQKKSKQTMINNNTLMSHFTKKIIAGLLPICLLAGCNSGTTDSKTTDPKAKDAAAVPAPPNANSEPKAGVPAGAKAAAAAKPALTVTVALSTTNSVATVMAANGSVAAWQEASVASEVAGLRIVELIANVGDTVRKGQLLVRLSDASIQTDIAAQRANVADAQAQLAEAKTNAERARQLDQTGAISAVQINQFFTAEKTAKARLDAAQARLKSDDLRLSYAKIVAPDDGLISLKTATVGAVVQPGQEMYRMIRKGRLEWRAEVPASELGRIKPLQKVIVDAGEGLKASGVVRMIAPTIDPATRNAVVFVDIAAGGAIKAGMYAKGTFDLGSTSAVTVPSAAVLRRDGFQYVYLVDSQSRVKQTKVDAGTQLGDRIEVKGIAANVRVVNTGVGFLADGDLVRVEAK